MARSHAPGNSGSISNSRCLGGSVPCFSGSHSRTPVQNQVSQPLQQCVTPRFPVETVRLTQHVERLPFSALGGAFSSTPRAAASAHTGGSCPPVTLRFQRGRLAAHPTGWPMWGSVGPPGSRVWRLLSSQVPGCWSEEGGAGSGSACPPASWGDTAFPSISQS